MSTRILGHGVFSFEVEVELKESSESLATVAQVGLSTIDDNGGLTLYIQGDSPGKDKESNWLPAPKDEFKLAMRLYAPKKEVADGTWEPPAVKRLS